MKQATKSKVPVIVNGKGKIDPPVSVEVKVSLVSHEPPTNVNPASHCRHEGIGVSVHCTQFAIDYLQVLQTLLIL